MANIRIKAYEDQKAKEEQEKERLRKDNNKHKDLLCRLGQLTEAFYLKTLHLKELRRMVKMRRAKKGKQKSQLKKGT